MTIGRHLWRTAAIIAIVAACLAIALLFLGSDGSIFFWPAWLIIASALLLAIGELRRK
jgi:hypothetical protein